MIKSLIINEISVKMRELYQTKRTRFNKGYSVKGLKENQKIKIKGHWINHINPKKFKNYIQKKGIQKEMTKITTSLKEASSRICLDLIETKRLKTRSSLQKNHVRIQLALGLTKKIINHSKKAKSAKGLVKIKTSKTNRKIKGWRNWVTSLMKITMRSNAKISKVW